MRKPDVRGSEGQTAIVAGHKAATIDGEKNALRVARIDHQVVDDQVGCGNATPFQSTVHALPQAGRAARVDHGAVVRILLDDANAARVHWDGFDFLKELSAIDALVDAGAGAGVDLVCRLLLEKKKEHVIVSFHCLSNLF